MFPMYLGNQDWLVYIQGGGLRNAGYQQSTGYVPVHKA